MRELDMDDGSFGAASYAGGSDPTGTPPSRHDAPARGGSLRADIAPSEAALTRWVGRSATAAALRAQLLLVARRDASVLLLGASGTGKELAARIVHELSPRRRGPFIAVDCGALAEGVLESELFGHARGAFTNATGDRRGLFEEADGGTIFLDEIANTSLSLQARLLRVLQEREVRRVGCNRARPIDVRVIAACNRDLSEEAVAGRFREDLYYRLDVLSVRLPALHERREDVPVLARHVLDELGRRAGVRYRLTSDAMTALIVHDWPGNVRELKNVLEHAAAFSLDGAIDVGVLPDRVARRTPPAASAATLSALMLAYERVLLCERLEANRWNRTRTAGELGITRRCLFDKIERHGLAPCGRRAPEGAAAIAGTLPGAAGGVAMGSVSA